MEQKNCPLEALIIITNEGKDTEEAIDILSELHISKSIISSAIGTAPTQIADLLGIGTSKKQIISTFVQSNTADELLSILTEKLQLDEKNRGIAFTLPLTALTSNILEERSIKL